MGFESFLVRLTDGKASFSDAEKLFRQLDDVVPDDHYPSTESVSCFRFDDGNHVIEFEIQKEPFCISCRFALCHPRSVDRRFLELIEMLMRRLSVKASVCDPDQPDTTRQFDIEKFAAFESLTHRCIDRERRMWIAMMGNETAAATNVQAFERFILPHATPIPSPSSSGK